VNEIIDHRILKATGNKLVLASRGAGNFIAADMTVVYKVNV